MPHCIKCGTFINTTSHVTLCVLCRPPLPDLAPVPGYRVEKHPDFGHVWMRSGWNSLGEWLPTAADAWASAVLHAKRHPLA